MIYTDLLGFKVVTYLLKHPVYIEQNCRIRVQDHISVTLIDLPTNLLQNELIGHIKRFMIAY